MSQALRNGERTDKGPGRTSRAEKDDRESLKTQRPPGARGLAGRKTWATSAGRSVCGPGASCVGITWELVRNAAPWAPRETCRVRICIRTTLPGDLYVRHGLRGTAALNHPEIHPSWTWQPRHHTEAPDGTASSLSHPTISKAPGHALRKPPG